jgi:hypothetical protein
MRPEVTMRTRFTFLVSVGIGSLALACTQPTARESTIRGTAALTTFPSAPSAISAHDESGHVVRAPVDPNGQFALPIAKGHTYRVALEGAGGSVPIVFPRAQGLLDATFVLKTNAAALRLGQVRHFAGAPSGGFHVLAAHAPGSAPAPTGGGDCVDCVNDDPQVSCEDSESPGSSGLPSSDSAEQADASGDLAVGDQNVPEVVDGCDQGDNVEQEGEH